MADTVSKSEEILKLLKGMNYKEIRKTIQEVMTSVESKSTY
ncbi:hypothetical protein [Olleya marilimosa]|nr:hypothetical protein [Olleya marilimosa]